MIDMGYSIDDIINYLNSPAPTKPCTTEPPGFRHLLLSSVVFFLSFDANPSTIIISVCVNITRR